jgi:serine/threonine protein phosphatase PrpC
MQGWRRTNEDAHITALDFDEGMHLFAVFDGHGGAEVARFCERHFISELKEDKEYQAKNYEAALRNVFLKLDKMVTTVEGKKELRQLVNPPKTSVIGVN